MIIILASLPQFYGAFKRKELGQVIRLLLVPAFLLGVGTALFIIGLSK